MDNKSQFWVDDEHQKMTVFYPDTYFEGTLEYELPLKIQGRFKGRIYTKGFLWIDENAVVDADVFVGGLKLGGTLRGNVDAEHKVELCSNAKLFGNVKTSRLKIADGVLLEGNCEMNILSQ